MVRSAGTPSKHALGSGFFRFTQELQGGARAKPEQLRADGQSFWKIRPSSNDSSTVSCPSKTSAMATGIGQPIDIGTQRRQLAQCLLVLHDDEMPRLGAAGAAGPLRDLEQGIEILLRDRALSR
ncbi:MAG: hypothetical protein R2855_02705 [Thermomicrobiales bacterium]